MTGSSSRRPRALPGMATAVAVLALLTACSHATTIGAGRLAGTGPSVTAGAGGIGTPGPGGSTGTPTGSATASTTATHTTGPLIHLYPSDYAKAVLDAWAAHDNIFLKLLTGTATVHQIQGFGNINQHWTHIRDDGASGSIYVSFYNNAGDEITIRLINAELSLHHWHVATVQSWDPMTFPSGATAYTKKYVDGWIAGNPARMDLLGTTALTTHYLGLDTPSSSYTLLPPSATAATEVEVEITDTATGLDTSVIIDTTKLGHQHAIGGCDIGC